MGPCMFCRATDRKITKEHVIPQWVLDLLEVDLRTAIEAEGGTVDVGHHGVRRATDNPYLLKVKGPCANCNNVWLGQGLEGPASTVLGPLIMERSADRIITAADQEIIATWGAKMALMLDHAWRRGGDRVLTEEDAHRFYADLRLPEGWTVAIAQHTSRLSAWPLSMTPLVGKDRTDRDFRTGIATIVLGHLIIQVRAHPYGSLATIDLADVPNDPRIPVGATPIQWPPSQVLDDAAVELFALERHLLKPFLRIVQLH